jgi:hypothetical protein
MQPKYDALYRALVTSITDATGMGKIRVQCPQIGGLAEIRSAEPANPGMPVPAVGTTVWIGFSGGDITKPTYLANSIPYIPPLVLVQDWTNISLVSGFTNNGNNNGTTQFQVVDEYGSRKVNFQGGINITYPSSTIANGGTFTTLASIARPTNASLRTLTAACSLASSTFDSLKIDVSSSGAVSIVGTNTTTIQPPWVSLNGLSYYL